MDDSANDLTEQLLSMFDDHHVEPVNRQSIVRAAFSIPGTKTNSIKHIMSHLPVRHTWVDHFGGSGIVTFNRPVSALEVLNDRYSGIVSFYRCVKDPAKYEQLTTYLENTQHSREEFYDAKQTWITATDDVTRAAKWYTCLRMSVIGKMDCFARSTHSKNQFFIASSLPGFYTIHQRLKGIILENLDFETCVKDFDQEDCVHYFDPPYIGTDPGVYEHKWTRDDLGRLLRNIREARGFCALSGYPDEQIDKETFWTGRYTWKVKAKAEVKAFMDENRKSHLTNVQEMDDIEEVLWIKE